MKTSIFRVASLSLLLVAGGCNKPTLDTSALEDRLSEIEDGARKQKQVTAALREDLKNAESRAELSRAEVQAATVSTAELKDSMATLTASFAQYKDLYRGWIQLHGPGMKLTDITVKGKSFHNVVVKSVNAYELAFLHDGGVARIQLADASQELRDKFAYVAGTVKPAASLPIGALADAPANASNDKAAMPVAGPSAASSAAASDAGYVGTDAGYVGTLVSKRRYETLKGGQVVEVIADFNTGGMGGGGKPVKGYSKDQMPPGYKPIGSGFSGSTLGKDETSDEKKKKKH
jgi:hypothetical protein